MKVVPSGVSGVAIHCSGSSEFEAGLESIQGGALKEMLRPALPFSVILENRSPHAIALLGVRFDMTGPRARHYSVVHYADTLRNPEKADFKPGNMRFVCAEPAYTSLAIRGGSVAGARTEMNLINLRRMLEIRASIDCVAFEDGHFSGPDTQGAFERFAREREIESAVLSEIAVLGTASIEEIEKSLVLAAADTEERVRRSVARKLLEGLAVGGREEMLVRAGNHRCRITLWRKTATSLIS